MAAKKKAAKKAKATKPGGTTLVSFVLDMTGSMASCWGQTISGYNEYIETLQRDKKGKYLLWRRTFNSDKTTVAGPDAIAKAELLTKLNYTPNNNTPLYDAIGDQIEAVKEKDHREAILFVIMTDGQENASQRYKREDIFKSIQELEKKGWTFVFLGANQDAWETGRAMGFAGANTMSYNAGATGQTMRVAAAATVMYNQQSGGQQVNTSRLMTDTLSSLKKKRMRKPRA